MGSRVVAALFCEAVSFRPGELFALLGAGLRTIRPPVLPVDFGRLAILVCVIPARDQDDHQIESHFELLAPNGAKMFGNLTTVTLPPDMPAAAREPIWYAFNLPPLRFAVAGRYIGRLWAGEGVLELALDVAEPPLQIELPAAASAFRD